MLNYSLYKNHVNFMYWKCGRLNLGNLGLCYISCQWIYHPNYLLEERGAGKMEICSFYLFIFEKQTHAYKEERNEIWSWLLKRRDTISMCLNPHQEDYKI